MPGARCVSRVHHAATDCEVGSPNQDLMLVEWVPAPGYDAQNAQGTVGGSSTCHTTLSSVHLSSVGRFASTFVPKLNIWCVEVLGQAPPPRIHTHISEKLLTLDTVSLGPSCHLDGHIKLELRVQVGCAMQKL